MNPENRPLVGGQIMRYSESKGYKISAVYERTELTTTVINFQKIVKWATIEERCCVVFTIVWNNYLQ